MKRLRCLDLYCCAGGAGVGYDLAGFDVYGVDIVPRPNYPFPFRQAGAISTLRRLLAGLEVPFVTRSGSVEWLTLADFDFIHASPPCQKHSALTKGNKKRAVVVGREHLDFIPATRRLLDETGLPYVIENVAGAPIRKDVRLCGEMFGLRVLRHRFFELGGWSMAQPEHKPHRGRVAGWRHGVYYEGPYVAPYGDGGGKGSVEEWQNAMEITWTDDRVELAEAIPPAYCNAIGAAFLAACADIAA